MFGFFKKKSGEVPEEQERLQKAAAREAERKETSEIGRASCRERV